MFQDGEGEPVYVFIIKFMAVPFNVSVKEKGTALHEKLGENVLMKRKMKGYCGCKTFFKQLINSAAPLRAVFTILEKP